MLASVVCAAADTAELQLQFVVFSFPATLDNDRSSTDGTLSVQPSRDSLQTKRESDLVGVVWIRVSVNEEVFSDSRGDDRHRRFRNQCSKFVEKRCLTRAVAKNREVTKIFA